MEHEITWNRPISYWQVCNSCKETNCKWLA